jgi:hypothetical protein
MLESHIFTFGVGHALSKYYVELKGNQSDTRDEMFRLFGSNWSFQYDNVRGQELVEKYRYRPLLVNSPMCMASIRSLNR